MIVLLLLWLIPTLSLTKPIRKFWFADMNGLSAWPTSAVLAGIWPLCVLMLLRKKFLTVMLSGD